MKVTSRAVAGRGGVLRVLDSAAPLTVRRIRSDDQRTCALCLVGTAAGPLAGDELTLCLHVEPGASLTLSAAGASIAQGRRADPQQSIGPLPALMNTRAVLGADAALTGDPGLLIVCDGSHVDVSLSLDLAETSTARWDETVLLGRSHDTGTGTAVIRWDVTRGGRPVLRQLVDLADPVLRAWPGQIGGRRVIASTFLTGPGVDARTIVEPVGDLVTAAAQRIDARTALVTALADDVQLAVAARERLVAMLAAGPGTGQGGSVGSCPR